MAFDWELTAGDVHRVKLVRSSGNPGTVRNDSALHKERARTRQPQASAKSQQYSRQIVAHLDDGVHEGAALRVNTKSLESATDSVDQHQTSGLDRLLAEILYSR